MCEEAYNSERLLLLSDIYRQPCGVCWLRSEFLFSSFVICLHWIKCCTYFMIKLAYITPPLVSWTISRLSSFPKCCLYALTNPWFAYSRLPTHVYSCCVLSQLSYWHLSCLLWCCNLSYIIDVSISLSKQRVKIWVEAFAKYCA